MFYVCTLHAMCSKFWLWYNQILHMNFWRNIKRARDTCRGSSKSKPSVTNIRKIINRKNNLHEKIPTITVSQLSSFFFLNFLKYYHFLCFPSYSSYALICHTSWHVYFFGMYHLVERGSDLGNDFQFGRFCVTTKLFCVILLIPVFYLWRWSMIRQLLLRSGDMQVLFHPQQGVPSFWSWMSLGR